MGIGPRAGPRFPWALGDKIFGPYFLIIEWLIFKGKKFIDILKYDNAVKFKFWNTFVKRKNVFTRSLFI